MNLALLGLLVTALAAALAHGAALAASAGPFLIATTLLTLLAAAGAGLPLARLRSPRPYNGDLR